MFVSAMQMGQSTGAGLGERLKILAQTIRARLTIEDKIVALTAQARLQARIMFCLPGFVAEALYLLDATAFEQAWFNTVGVWVAGGIVALFLIACLWAWRGRYLLLLQGGSSLKQAAWQAWEAPFSRVLNVCLSLPFVHDWPERLWGSYANEIRGFLSKRVALTALLTSLAGVFLLSQGAALVDIAGLIATGFLLSLLQAISRGRKLQRQHHSRCRRDLPFFSGFIGAGSRVRLGAATGLGSCGGGCATRKFAAQPEQGAARRSGRATLAASHA